jgi:Bacterial Ig-like domain (group 3)/FG-GAP-like repeat
MGFRRLWVAALFAVVLATGSQDSGAAVTSATTLTISVGGKPLSAGTSVTSGSVISLSAAVSAGSSSLTAGQVNFCDASAASCTDIHLISAAQLTSAGTATVSFTPPPGTHSYKAVFQGTPNAATAYAGSTSNSITLTVTGPYPSITSLDSADANASQYNLTAIVGSAGPNAPTGTVSFVDTSDANTVLASSALGSATTGLTFLPPGINGLNGLPDISLIPPLGAVLYGVGDFNGDGHLDLVVFSSGGCIQEACSDGGATVYLGDGNGNFTQGAFLDLPGQTKSIQNLGGVSQSISSFAIGDFNGDGITDLAMATSTDSSTSDQMLTIALGNGDGTFTPRPAISTGGDVTSMVAGDFNGDGILDLAMVNTTANAITLFTGNGDGTFTASSAPVSDAGAGATSMVAADFNGDGLLDLAVVNSDSPNVTILLANGNGSFTTEPPVTTAGNALALASGDFNGDGLADLAVVNYDANSKGQVTIFLGKGNGTFTEAPGSPITSVTADGDLTGFYVGDFNADGTADLIDNSGSVLLGNGDGTFALTQVPGLELLVSDLDPELNVVADFNSDGATDLLIGYVIAFSAPQSASALVSGVAAPPATGSNVVLATYPGDSAHNPSQSGTVTLMAGQGVPTVIVTASPNPAYVNTPVTLTATVQRNSATAAMPTGTVTFYDGSALLASATLNSSGDATLTSTALAVGTNSVIASYYGDTNYVAATSQAVTVTIAPVGTIAPTVTLTTSSGSITTAQTMTVAVTVGGASGSPAPTGYVTLSSGSWMAQQPLASGSASFTISAGMLGTGSDTLTAAYSGDPNYAAASATGTVTVSQLVVAVSSTSPVSPGASATATETVNAGSGYSGTLNLTCSLASSPAGAQSLPACAVNPSSLTLKASGSGTATLTITTTSGSSSALLRGNKIPGLGGGAVALAGLLLLGLPARRLRWLAVLAFACLFLVSGLIGCGGNGQQHSNSGTSATTAGTYTFTVTATDSANSAISNSATVSVAVQ